MAKLGLVLALLLLTGCSPEEEASLRRVQEVTEGDLKIVSEPLVGTEANMLRRVNQLKKEGWVILGYASDNGDSSVLMERK